MKIVQGTISLQDVINAYNDFDGMAMIVKDAQGCVECVAGQNECFVDGYDVIISKSCKEEKDLYLTYDELAEGFFSIDI